MRSPGRTVPAGPGRNLRSPGREPGLVERVNHLPRVLRRIAATADRIRLPGGATRTRMRNRSRSAGQRAHEIASKLNCARRRAREQAEAEVLRATGALAELADKAVTDAGRLLINAKRTLRRARAKAARLKACGQQDAAAGRRRGRLAGAVNDLSELLTVTGQIAEQTRQRLAGTTPNGSTRRVSLHDPDARPIAKGRLGKPIEFGQQGPGHRQRRRHRARPHHRAGQPRRRAPAGTRGRDRAGGVLCRAGLSDQGECGRRRRMGE